MAGGSKLARASPKTVSPLQPRLRNVTLRSGKAAGQGRFPVAVALLALDERVADQHDAVAVGELEFVGGRERREEHDNP